MTSPTWGPIPEDIRAASVLPVDEYGLIEDGRWTWDDLWAKTAIPDPPPATNPYRPPPAERVSVHTPPEQIMDWLRGLLEQRGRVDRLAGGFKACCPAHEDRTPSLSVKPGDRRVMAHCFAGCDEDAVLAALGATTQDLFYDHYEPATGPHRARTPATPSNAPDRPPRPSPAPPADLPVLPDMTSPKLGAPTAVYHYTDPDGTLLYAVARYTSPDGKTFRQYTPAPGGWWAKGPADQDKTLYRADLIARAIPQGAEIIIVEGEKDADNGNQLGLEHVAFTTCAGGANAPWLPQYTHQLQQARAVRILIDWDELNNPDNHAGHIHGTKIAQALQAAHIPHRVVRSDRAKDLTDHLAAGGTLNDLVDAEPADLDQTTPDLELAFWATRPVLLHIHDCALSQQVSPWGLLGAALAEAAARIPINVVLPPIGYRPEDTSGVRRASGAEATPNLMVNLVGTSADGKGLAMGAAKESFDWPDTHIDYRNIGTGEGITARYAHHAAKDNKETGIKAGDLVFDRHAVLWDCDEIDSLNAQAARRGSTILPVLRSAWSGSKTLGYTTAATDRGVNLPPFTYRFCMVAGVQPGRGKFLLDDIDGGTPQRFLWLPAADPSIPEYDQVPLAPAVMQIPAVEAWKLPRNPRTGRYLVPVCEQATRDVRHARYLAGQGQVDALDGHALLTRLKVGLALSVLDGRCEVSLEDWELAGWVMAKSDQTRAKVINHARVEARRRHEAEVAAESDKTVRVDLAKRMATLARVKAKLVRAAARHPGCAQRVLRDAVEGKERAEFFVEALQQAQDEGLLVEVDGVWNVGAKGVEA